MQTMYGLTKQQMREVFEYMRAEYLRQDIEDIMFETDYIINGEDISGDLVASRIDIDCIINEFLSKDEFNWCLLEELIEQEVSNKEDYILTGKCY